MSRLDAKTIAVYDTQAKEYAARRANRIEPGLTVFTPKLRQGGHVLDLGCGPGDASVHFLKAGFTVDAVDASASMVALTRELGVNARQATFDQIDQVNAYDGIWASYSLLHAARSDMPDNLARLRTALKPGGKLHIGLKLGSGESRDPIGRYYTYYALDELIGLLETAGFTPEAWETEDAVGLDGKAYQGIWMHANG
ncbi:class I SAM-dependent methyltransferase [Aliiroseovarius sp. F20344]|uniref:class I SAM-dependent DNA methyltransferase n=1 Tax=Aliiroseovarius sp. F20344 TaxID=2926414 RepID=UPI001FF17731|nr:class I SAM-dependent methyltransferase [Aliiroseovarius sp. F20344]MCK0140943.1 class I SAM-dependent methyltransferase [Aliiroseovarius sp. F20344]